MRNKGVYLGILKVDDVPGSLEVRKRIFCDAIFILKTIILPRQARDKHREDSKKDAFLGGARLALPVPNGSPASVDGAKNACI